MSGINFLHKDEKASQQAEKVKLVVMPITTAVLVVYLVLISGLFGWWWWWNSKQVKVSSEYSALVSLVNSKQTEEILARRLRDRVRVTNAYLNSRSDLYVQTSFAQNMPVQIVGYSVELDGYYTLTVEASDSAAMELAAFELSDRFKDVFLKSLSWDMERGNWQGVYFYRGKKI